jgi:plasmid maintenance system antidote protein VapI
MPETIAPVSPGEVLEEELLKPLPLTKYRLAKSIGVPAQRIGEIAWRKIGKALEKIAPLEKAA